MEQAARAILAELGMLNAALASPRGARAPSGRRLTGLSSLHREARAAPTSSESVTRLNRACSPSGRTADFRHRDGRNWIARYGPCFGCAASTCARPSAALPCAECEHPTVRSLAGSLPAIGRKRNSAGLGSSFRFVAEGAMGPPLPLPIRPGWEEKSVRRPEGRRRGC
jgi:hypothetical protein